MNLTLKYIAIFVFITFIFAILTAVFYQSSTPLKSPSVIPAQAGIHPSNSTTTPKILAITPELTLLFGGDVMLGRTVNTQIIKKADYTWPLANIASISATADLFMVNLEGPFKSGCKPTDTGMVFCADPLSIQTLVASGVDVVTLANNHIYNQGPEGLSQTITILSKNNISYTGLKTTSSILTVKNTKIAIEGFNDIPPYPAEINKLTEENLQTKIKRLRSQADLVIVTFHWGNEYSKASQRQKDYAHLAIDLGADAVIGHHPHWVQEKEIYKDKPIYYSLGNLVFDQMWSEETKKGLMVKLTYQNNKLINLQEFPLKIFDYGLPALEGSPAVVDQSSPTSL